MCFPLVRGRHGVEACESAVSGPPETGLARRGKPLTLAGSPLSSHPSAGSACFQGGLGDGKYQMGVKLPLVLIISPSERAIPRPISFQEVFYTDVYSQ